MQDQGIEPPHDEAVEPSQQDVEARLLAVLLDEDSEQVACADVIHTYGPLVLLSRATKRAFQTIEGAATESIH